MNKKGKPIDPKRADDVPDFLTHDFLKAEFVRLKELCSSILQEEKKAEEKHNANEKAQALKNYVIIRSVGIAEGVLKSMAAYLIDRFKISMRSISGTNSWDGDMVQIHLDELGKIKNLTVGKIITSQRRFANAREIGDIFQAINRINGGSNARKHPFFDWLQNLSPLEKSDHNLYIELTKMIKKRNKTTHDPYDVVDSSDDIKKQITNLQALTNMIWYASWFNLSRSDPDYDESWKKKDASQCGITFAGLTLDKFVKITAKHIKN